MIKKKIFYQPKGEKGRGVSSLFHLCLLLLFLPQFSLANDSRIVGYLPYYRFNLVDQMELDKLTHLVIAFGHPDVDGRVEVPTDIRPVIEKAKNAGVKVLLSLGGGALYPEDEKYWKSYLQPEKRSIFIRNIVQYLHEYALDGIDIDLEWKYVDKHYSGFVLAMEESLRPYGKLLTAALPAITRYDHLNDDALMAFDFVNLMVYDLTGPFEPNRPGQHSPFSFAVNSINFWRGEGLSSERMTLGLPLFGWNFSVADTVSSVTFRELVAMDISFAQLDQIGKIYYNGLSMIKAKTELALEEVSGVMLWELGQDAYNEHSLLRAVHDVMHTDNTRHEQADISEHNIIISDSPPFLGGRYPLKDQYSLERRQGRLVLFRRRNAQDLSVMPIPTYPPGFYFSVHWIYETLQNR